MTLLEQLKARVGTLAAGFSDPVLQTFIDNIKAKTGWTDAGNAEDILDVAHAKVCLALASDTARYFKYTQNAESVDKTATPEQLRQIARDLLALHPEAGGTGVTAVVELDVPEEFVTDRDGGTEE